MRLEIIIDMENESFRLYPENEVTRILETIIDNINGGLVYGRAYDVNGNRVGKWGFVE